MFDAFQNLLIGSTFRERKQMIEQAKANEKWQQHLKNSFVYIELSKMAAADSKFIGNYSSAQEWKKELTKWETITDKKDTTQLANILDISIPVPLNIAGLPVESKKVIYGILHFGQVEHWARKKSILRNYSSIDKQYEDLIAYQSLKELGNIPDSQNLESEFFSLKTKFDKQEKTLEEIQNQLERLLSKAKK